MKWGIIGLGSAGTSHGKRVSEMAGLELAGGYDPVPEARQAFADELGVPVFDDLGALLADESIVCVTVASSSLYHADLAVEALGAGKHVMVEKPFAPDAPAVRRMIEAAHAAGRVLAPFHNRRFDPDFLMVQEVLDSGRLGTLRRIHSFVGGPGKSKGWRAVRDQAGGRLYDWGPHLLDQVLSLTSADVTDVWGVTHTPDGRGDADEYFRAEIRMADGLDITTEMSGFSFLPPMRWEILGDTGTLQVTGNIHSEFTLSVCCEGGEPEVTATTAAAERERRGDGGVRVYQAMADCVAGHGELAVTPEHALKVARVIDAVRESADKGMGSVGI